MPLLAMFNGASVLAGGSNPHDIGAAVESDGEWTEYAGSPVVRKGAAGEWDDNHIKDPCVLYDGTKFVLYYAGSANGYPQYQIGRATSYEFNGPWTKDAGNPVLAQGGSFDSQALSFPAVLYEPEDTGREWKMWYAGSDNVTTSIIYAYSSDGISWTKYGIVLNAGAPGTWSSHGAVPGSIYKDGSTYYLFVGGMSFTGPVRHWTGGVYTFTDPEGVYTAEASNPTLMYEGISNDLTADTNTGSKVVTIGDTSTYVAGEPMSLWATNRDTHVSGIESIDSPTQLTLLLPAPSTFSVASSAKIRPMTINGVMPRTVVPYHDGYNPGYKMYMDCHQATIDLDPIDSQLREGCMEAVSSSLTGAWTILQYEGLLFPLAAPGTKWDAISAENPSVISSLAIGGGAGGQLRRRRGFEDTEYRR